MTRIRKWIILIGVCTVISGSHFQVKAQGAIAVEVVNENGNFVLYRGSEPYFIKGAGGQVHLDTMVEMGANSFRLWSTDSPQKDSGKSPKELLDKAEELGLTVTLGLWVVHPRHDNSFYDDPGKVQAQLDDFKQDVLEFKDHPALLMWAVGNEVHLETTDKRVWDAVEDIVQMIHEEDPNHPVSTVTADLSQTTVNDLKSRVPSLDILGINVYGNDQVNMPQKVRNLGWQKPYFIGESGPTAHWQVSKTSWGASLEPLGHQKAATYLNAYEAFEADDEMCFGGYAFKWGWKWERTYSWMNIFTPEGLHGEVADALHYAWKGTDPENKSPEASTVLINGINPNISEFTIEVGKTFEATTSATDPDGDEISYEWILYPESTSNSSGGDEEEIPDPVEGAIVESNANMAVVIAPETSGPYRLYVFAQDGNNHVSISNHPFLVTPKELISNSDTIYSVEDSFVRGGNYANDNYGIQPYMISKLVSDNDSFTRETYLKFDLKTLSDQFSGIELNLYGIVGNGVQIAVYEVQDYSWSENDIIWHNKPSTGKLIDEITLPSNGEGYFSWEITDFINSALMDGKTKVSMMVQAKSETEREIRWSSKEAIENPPFLKAHVVTAVDLPTSASYSIYPNPANNYLNLAIENPQLNSLDVTIYNAMGRLMKKLSFGRADIQRILDLSHFSEGYYSMRINDGQNITVKPFIVKK